MTDVELKRTLIVYDFNEFVELVKKYVPENERIIAIDTESKREDNYVNLYAVATASNSDFVIKLIYAITGYELYNPYGDPSRHVHAGKWIQSKLKELKERLEKESFKVINGKWRFDERKPSIWLCEDCKTGCSLAGITNAKPRYCPFSGIECKWQIIYLG
ncbi:hypothetical protein DRO29_01190 [Candidatus Bathyarchaeota archaeon]|nr:MAG: hypothetical protein DRO29_01190 [Candidatus Bathyarchaeota archaeon]